MPSLDLLNETTLVRSPRVLQLESLFDVPPSATSVVSWHADLPLSERSWHVGLIVGPSGSGKTTTARALFGEQVVSGYTWSDTASVVDAFPASLGIKEITACLSAVGFGSPPAWLRPYRCLSTGEQFRVTIARALAEAGDLVVIDEFTSVVDRHVAQLASHTVQKSVRQRGIRFVAVSCHEDLIDWLQPDWIYRPAGNQFIWRCLRPHPPISIRITAITRAAWPLFRHYHYLSGDLARNATCFGGWQGDRLIAFTSYTHFPHPRVRDIKLGHRLVVLPDYQGFGIGGRLDDWLGQYLFTQGYRYHNVVTHPAMISSYAKSPRWHLVHAGRGSAGSASSAPSLHRHQRRRSAVRQSAAFEYVPLPLGTWPPGIEPMEMTT